MSLDLSKTKQLANLIVKNPSVSNEDKWEAVTLFLKEKAGNPANPHNVFQAAISKWWNQLGMEVKDLKKIAALFSKRALIDSPFRRAFQEQDLKDMGVLASMDSVLNKVLAATGWKKSVAMMLLADAVASTVEGDYSEYGDDADSKGYGKYLNDFIRSQQDIVELFEGALQDKDLNFDKYYPKSTIEKMEATWNEWVKKAGVEYTLDDLWYDSEKAVFHFAMESVGHGVGIADDQDDVDLLAEKGLVAKDAPSSYIESPYDEAYLFLEDYDAAVQAEQEDEEVEASVSSSVLTKILANDEKPSEFKYKNYNIKVLALNDGFWPEVREPWKNKEIAEYSEGFKTYEEAVMDAKKEVDAHLAFYNIEQQVNSNLDKETTPELKNLLKFLRQTVEAIELGQETPERLEERAEALDDITEVEQELLKRGEDLVTAGTGDVLAGSWSNYGFRSAYIYNEISDAEELMSNINLKLLNLSEKNKALDALEDMRVRVVLDGPKNKTNLVVAYPRSISKNKKLVDLYEKVSKEEIKKVLTNESIISKVLAAKKSSFSFKNKTQQKKALKEFLTWMYEGRLESEEYSDEEAEEFYKHDHGVEDQLTGVSDTVNGKRVNDVYKEITKGLTEEEIKKIAEALPFIQSIENGWAYYDGDKYVSDLKKKHPVKVKASVKNVFKFRAETIVDVVRAAAYFSLAESYTVVKKAGFPDVVVTLETSLPIEEVKTILHRVPDGHVMVQTLAPEKEYTGNRVV